VDGDFAIFYILLARRLILTGLLGEASRTAGLTPKNFAIAFIRRRDSVVT
jgi:hypothetical protein